VQALRGAEIAAAIRLAGPARRVPMSSFGRGGGRSRTWGVHDEALARRHRRLADPGRERLGTRSTFTIADSPRMCARRRHPPAAELRARRRRYGLLLGAPSPAPAARLAPAESEAQRERLRWLIGRAAWSVRGETNRSKTQRLDELDSGCRTLRQILADRPLVLG